LAPKIKLTLFIRTGQSGWALSQLYKALEFHSYTDYQLEIVDADAEPTMVKQCGISNFPAVLKHLERENIHYAGDFTDIERMRTVFGLNCHARMA